MTSDKSSSSGVPAFTKDRIGYGTVADGSLFVRKCGLNGKAEVEWVSDGYAQIIEEN